jgi:predicted RNase H-like nuclease (RuvC/YqgF family)
MEWSLVGGVAITTLGYIFGRKVSNAEATKKLEEASKLRAETNAINIASLQAIVESYKAQVDNVEKKFKEDKRSYTLAVNAFENHTAALEKQVKVTKLAVEEASKKNKLLEKENRSLRQEFKRKYTLLETQVKELTKRNAYLEQELLTIKQ